MNPAEMNSERWRIVKPLLESALELKVEDRRAFLDQACAGDEALRRDVESFIAAREQAGDFMEKTAFEETARRLAEEKSVRKTLALDRVATDKQSHNATTLIDDEQNFMLAPGAILDGRYQIERELGQGGAIGYAPLPARSSGERRIDRNQTPPKSPRLRRVIITCNPAHPTQARGGISNRSSANACTLEAMRTLGVSEE